jgi:hypothetical protein
VRRRLAASLGCVVLFLALQPPAARAAEYEMATVARYVADPATREIGVTVDVTFTNTLPNPPGQLSGFDHVTLALHDGASGVTASDARGALSVSLGTVEGVAVASVKTRSRVRYNRTVSFTLAYVLADGSAPDVHVRPEVVRFAAFGFGTSSEVSVELPATYTVRADGDPMVTTPAGDRLRLTSGPIIDLQVRAWVDDPQWGIRTMDALADALPLLEAAIGLPYPRVGPLMVTEAIGGGGSEEGFGASNGEIQVAFDAPTFTLLHQAAHIWITPELAADRWIREGLASHYAAGVARTMGVAAPYDPAQRTAELTASARPLAAWDASSAPDGDAYAYAASWTLADRIAVTVGDADLSAALQRVMAGVSAYDPGGPVTGAAAPGSLVAPVDTRGLLDQLATVSGVDLSPLFGELALGPDGVVQLAQRAAARGDYARLEAKAGDWGVPDPIRALMAAWHFDEARPAIAAASRWLSGRDALVATIADAGLAPPDALRARYVADGGGPEAQAELDAERAVAGPYLALQRRMGGSIGPLERIGLFGADDPRRVLAQAGASFAAGDLRAAATRLDQAQVLVDRAAANGIVRVAGAVLLLAVGFLIVARSRRREGSHYTAAP